ncbi:MAG: DUF91 domain-containing protein [Planctomycetes bacterium]|nr:DUF91 domain-containing protein [Planctomycetota bacterium]
MANRWEKFVERYANDPFYWYQPKGFTIKPPNLSTIRERLRVLVQYEGKHWRRVQIPYTDALLRERLIKPRCARKGSPDYAALVRMIKEVHDSLGLVWVGEESVIQITPAGRAFLRCREKELPTLVARQLRRYMYPNPAVGRAEPEAGVFPYLALLAVLTHFPSGVPLECYELFIGRMRDDGDVTWATELIRAYLALGDAERQALLAALERLPIIKEGRIVATGRRKSLLNTLQLNRSYMLSFLGTPGLVSFDAQDQRLSINPLRFDEAERLVQEHMRQDFYIRFRNIEDWIAFYGEPERSPTAAEALDHYRSRSEVEEALRLFQDMRARRELPPDLRALPEGEFRRLQVLERTMEDFLEFNLDLLENGLKLVRRQYPTPTGPLDLLAQDSRRRWVVIELKRGRASDRTVGQLLRYMAFIVQERARGEKGRVRGFAVAQEPDQRLVQAAAGAGAPLEVFESKIAGRANRIFPPRQSVSR